MAIGLKFFKNSEINCEQAVKIFKNKKKNIAFLDVRDRKTYVKNFAFGSVNCPLDQLKLIINDLVPDKSTFLIIIGNTKKNTKILSSILYKKQFTNFHFIKNGYKDWLRKKLPTWGGEFTLSKAFGEWIEKVGKIKNIYPKQLHKLHLIKKNSFLQIDARPKNEYEKFTIPLSKHCSGGELPAYLNINKSKKTLVVHCAGRTRSIIAYQTLLDFNFNNKKYVLNGGTQNWVLNGLNRINSSKSDLNKNKLNFKKDMILAKKIIKKFRLPTCNQAPNYNIKKSYSFIVQSEMIKNKDNFIWKKVNATTLIQSTDRFIAASSSKIYIYSDIPTSAVFAVIWLNRMGYKAIWHKKKPIKKQKKEFYKKNILYPTYFFPKRHLGKKEDSIGYLNWEHDLIPTICKWGCKRPWFLNNSKNIKNSIHPIHKIYSNFF